MDAQAIRRRGGLNASRLLRRGLCGAVLALAGAGVQADTSYDDGPTLARRLLAAVVRIDADEHGFGLVVGADRDFVYVATARHVVGTGTKLHLSGCDTALPSGLAVEHIASFDRASDDLALLRVPRPTDFTVQTRALASPQDVAMADAAWLLGRNDTCAVLPRSGAVAAPPNARALWRVDMPGVLGGSSGAPVATGRGIIGITTDSDGVNATVLDIALVALRVRASALPFDLVKADNIPPLDPQAAEQDLGEMLNRFLRELRDAQTVLRQPTVQRDYFTKTVTEYNVAAERFIGAMNKHDGTLRTYWQPGVAQAWSVLRDRLWAAHENFRFINQHAPTIVKTERVPDVVRDRMEALDPELTGIQDAISQFLRSLNEGKIVHANTPS